MIEPAVARIIEEEELRKKPSLGQNNTTIDLYLYNVVRDKLTEKVAALGKLRNSYVTIELAHRHYITGDLGFTIGVFIGRYPKWHYFQEFNELWKFLDHQHLLYRKF